jgi:hypothetical protein
MCNKKKLITISLCAMVMFVGIFELGSVTAQAQSSTGSATTTASVLSIEQLRQIVNSLIQQIQQLIKLIAVLKPQETCGNGICRFGETATSCPADCGTVVCAKKDALCGKFPSMNAFGQAAPSQCCAGLTCKIGSNGLSGTCVESNICGNGVCDAGETAASCAADCAAAAKCAKEGEYTSGAVAPQYYYTCCGELKGFNPWPANWVGGGNLCYDPKKGMPVCKNAGTRAEGWYYPDGTLLKLQDCDQQTTCGLEGAACTLNKCEAVADSTSATAEKCVGSSTCCTGYSCVSGKCVKPTVCGNGTCDAGETATSCPADCGTVCLTEGQSGGYSVTPAGIEAWNASPQKCCAGLDKVSTVNRPYNGACQLTAGYAGFICTHCGDGVCKNGEDYCNCPADCPLPACKKDGETLGLTTDTNASRYCCAGLTAIKTGWNSACTGYSNITCTSAVCGDGTCSSQKGESACNCLQDCGDRNCVVAIQTGVSCCMCPKKVPASQIGTSGWVVYEEGKDYRSLKPSNCQGVACADCQYPYSVQTGCVD